ncbi:MAG: phosphate acyltransferase PlsX [Pseudomonadota bacterium]
MTPSAPADRAGPVISVDALGAEGGPGAIVGGMERVRRRNSDVAFLLHGERVVFEPLLARAGELANHVEIRDVSRSISMDEKPSRALRQGKGTSMWNALASVEQGEAAACVSCGNTGALMALSLLRLRPTDGIDRPAIAVLWPSRNPSGYNVVLDVGADIRADAADLRNYAIMGAAYARHGLDLTRPRIGLLNVGTEDHKGRPELRDAAGLIADAATLGDFSYIGFVEGSDIAAETVDIIVTDGFTGNVALKSAEGTASIIRDLTGQAFRHSWFSRIGALFAWTSLRRLRKRIDPRRVNGGVFLGLRGTVVKSHGSADATGVAAALALAIRLARSGFAEHVAARVASGLGPVQDAVQQGSEAKAT